jgi:two-component system sensor histidine kinase YesM
LKLIVRDNGTGVSVERLKEIQESLEIRNSTDEHCGLSNIAYRLRELVIGASLEIYSVYKEGFISVISIPMDKEYGDV